jgi:signal transduction histidine kinase
MRRNHHVELILSAITAPCAHLATESHSAGDPSFEELLIHTEASLAVWRFPQARQYAQRLADHPGRINEHYQCTVLSLSARLALAAGDPRAALRGIATAIEQASSPALRALIRYQWAAMLEMIGNYPDALRAYTDALSNLDSSTDILALLVRLGAARIEGVLGDYDNALRTLDSKPDPSALANEHDVASLLHAAHHAELLTMTGRAEEAIALLSSVRPTAVTPRTKYAVAIVDLAMLSAYRACQQWDRAGSFGEALAQHLEDEGLPYLAARAWYEYAQLFSEFQSPYYSPPLALEHLRRALVLLEHAPFCDLHATIHLRLAQTYHAIKHDRKAFIHLEKFTDFHTTALSIRTAHAIKETEIELATRQRDLEIADLRRQNHELHMQLNDALRTVEEYKQRMDEQIAYLGVVAHDLKNPLAAIMMSASILERYGQKLTHADLEKHTSAITRTAEWMKELVTQLLDFTALSTGRMTLAIEPVHAGLLFDAVIEVYRVRALAKSLTIHKQYDAADCFVLADSRRLQECLDNLLSNAIKYSPLGRQIYCSIVVNGEQLRFLVRDEGPGLSQQEQQRLFREFTRARSAATGSEGGTGLGLRIVRRFVEAMHGTVGCISAPGKGSTFYIELPIAAPPNGSQQHVLSSPQRQAQSS